MVSDLRAARYCRLLLALLVFMSLMWVSAILAVYPKTGLAYWAVMIVVGAPFLTGLVSLGRLYTRL